MGRQEPLPPPTSKLEQRVRVACVDGHARTHHCPVLVGAHFLFIPCACVSVGLLKHHRGDLVLSLFTGLYLGAVDTMSAFFEH